MLVKEGAAETADNTGRGGGGNDKQTKHMWALAGQDFTSIESRNDFMKPRWKCDKLI